MPGYQPKIYREPGGSRQVVASGGSLDVESGGEIDIESGGSLKLAGTALTCTAAELNRATDVSARSVAAGATLTLTELAHEGRTILLDTAAGSVVTLPAPVVGARFRFLVSVKPTSNFHQIKVAASTDFMAGSVNILDLDGTAQAAYNADGTADDNIQLNGGTKGGQVGDWIEIEGLASTIWAIRGQLTVPTGSNPADMFSAAV